MITSLSNPRIKDALKLRERRHRTEQRQFLVEGSLEIQRAVAGGYEVSSWFICEELLDALSRDILKSIPDPRDSRQVTWVSRAVFQKLSLREGHAGLVAVAQMQSCDLESVDLDLWTSEAGLILVVEGIEKPGNLGAILRVADGLAARAVICVDGIIDKYNPNVIRSSVGAVFGVPVIECDFVSFREWLPAGVTLITTWPGREAQEDYYTADLSGPIAVVLGEEHLGLGAHWLKMPSKKLRIPMRGQCDSLNLAVATALLGYEHLRQSNYKSNLSMS